jgi:S1-C subfamily serine protease
MTMTKESKIAALLLTAIVSITSTSKTWAQSTPSYSNSIESMLMGNYGPNGVQKNVLSGQKPSKNIDEFKLLNREDLELRQGSKVIANIAPDNPPKSVGGAQIYRNYSRSVVLVISADSLGSGVIINKSGDIVTNWHVVGHKQEVFVVFKPLTEGQQLQKTDLIRARVIKIDDVADLALLHLESTPSDVRPLPLGNVDDLIVGADVHAIGHPTGQGWSYTKGVVSQIRQGYTWRSSGEQGSHKANVIQTQTPINPGNSGGPLISDTGLLVGINSFKSDGEGLNFAVGVDEVKRFLSSTGSRITTAPPANAEAISAKRDCQPKILYDGPSQDRTMNKRGIDIDCDGKSDIEVRTPYDVTKPIMVAIDNNKDGRPDEVIFDTDRDGRWDYSLHDTNFDGKWDLIGRHPDGKIKASRYEPYKK